MSLLGLNHFFYFTTIVLPIPWKYISSLKSHQKPTKHQWPPKHLHQNPRSSLLISHQLHCIINLQMFKLTNKCTNRHSPANYSLPYASIKPSKVNFNGILSGFCFQNDVLSLRKRTRCTNALFKKCQFVKVHLLIYSRLNL